MLCRDPALPGAVLVMERRHLTGERRRLSACLVCRMCCIGLYPPPALPTPLAPRHGSGFIHPKLAPGLGRDPALWLWGGWVKERSLKPHGVVWFPMAGGSAMARPHRVGELCRGRSLAGWGAMVAGVCLVAGFGT